MEWTGHQPVLLEECIRYLSIKPDGLYVDGTCGMGGHSYEIASRLKNGHLICIDKDNYALEQAAENMRLSKQQYEVGFEPLSDYLETQASWQQCSANLVNARCQMQLAQVRLLKAAGNLR